MQAKSYIETGGNIPEKLEDISWIKDVSECFVQTSSSTYPSTSDFNSSVTAKLIFCISIFLNILILIFTVLYLGKVFVWIEQSQHKHLKDLYKASAIGVLACMQLCVITSSLVFILSVICELQCSEVSGNNIKEANNQRDTKV